MRGTSPTRTGICSKKISTSKFMEGSVSSPRWQQLLSSLSELILPNKNSRNLEALLKGFSLRARMRSRKRFMMSLLTSKLETLLKSSKYQQQDCLVVFRISSTRIMTPSKKSSSYILWNISWIAYSMIRRLSPSKAYVRDLSSEVSSWATRELTDEQRRLTSNSCSASDRSWKYCRTGRGLCLMRKEQILWRCPRQVALRQGSSKISRLSPASSSFSNSTGLYYQAYSYESSQKPSIRQASLWMPPSSSSGMSAVSCGGLVSSQKKSSAMAGSSLERISVMACAAALRVRSSRSAQGTLSARKIMRREKARCDLQQRTNLFNLLRICCAMPGVWKNSSGVRSWERRSSSSDRGLFIYITPGVHSSKMFESAFLFIVIVNNHQTHQYQQTPTIPPGSTNYLTILLQKQEVSKQSDRI